MKQKVKSGSNVVSDSKSEVKDNREEDAENQNPMNSITLDGVPFSLLVQRAAKIKEHQSASLRTKFDSYPTFYQNTVFLEFTDQKIKAIRSSVSFEEKMKFAMELKNEGNSLFQDQRYNDAMNQYIKAAGIFRYLKNTNVNWKTQGIRDEHLIEIDDASLRNNATDNKQLQKQKEEIINFVRVCYTNIALVHQKQNDYKNVVKTCDYVLQEMFDPTHSKTLYLRALARINLAKRTSSLLPPKPPSSTELVVHATAATESNKREQTCSLNALAIQDLKLALDSSVNNRGNLNNNNHSEVSDEDRIKNKLKRLRRQMYLDKEREKSIFGNIFKSKKTEKKKNNGMCGAQNQEVEQKDISYDVMNQQKNSPKNKIRNRNGDKSTTTINKKQDQSCRVGENLLNRAKQIAKEYELNGKTKECEEIQKVIVKVENEIESKKLAAFKGLNFRNPSKEMKDEAKARGIDLNDPVVIEMLEDLQRNRNDTVKQQQQAEYLKSRRQKIQDVVSRMSIREIKKELQKNGVPLSFLPGKVQDQYKDLLIQVLLDSDDSKLCDMDRDDYSQRLFLPQKNIIVSVCIVAVVLFFVW